MFFMECRCSNQELAMEHCFCDSLLWIDKDDAKGRTVHLTLEEEDKYETIIEAKTL